MADGSREDALPDGISEGDNGALIVRLDHRLEFKNDVTQRLTVRRMKVLDYRASVVPTMHKGTVDLFAVGAQLCEPRGAFNELLHASDAERVMAAAQVQLGKFDPSTKQPMKSASTTPASDEKSPSSAATSEASVEKI